MISYNICLSLSDLLHLVSYSPGPSMLLQMAIFCSFLWLIFHCVCVYIYTHTPYIFLNHSSVDGHLVCFHVFVFERLDFFKKFSLFYVFIWLCRVLVAARGLLSCGMQTLSCGVRVGSSSPTSDRTRAPCVGSVES